ncbi:MAG: hypothetical protein DRJ97_03665 [Thermoprotei archaeon]|nr:MAG: hypothetical protein DRJ97_03665 [Thermoprotei archaeon]
MELSKLGDFKGALLVIGLSGYTDAAGVASFSANYLIRQTEAEKLGRLEGEFYVYVASRPTTTIKEGIVEEVRYPSLELYASRRANLLVMRGEEPNINWEAYLEKVMEVVDAARVSGVYTLGGLIDYLDQPKVSAVISTPRLRRVVEEAGMELIDYEGPCSVYTALIHRCSSRDLEAVSLWGHVPFSVYSTLSQLKSPDLKTAYLTLEALRRISGLDFNLEELREEAERLMELVDRIKAGKGEQPSKFYNYIY